jgi:multiple sugar transport system substrate-binding protein
VAVAVVLGGCSLLHRREAEPIGTGPITFATGRDISAGRQVVKLVQQWTAEHPDQEVSLVELPSSADQARAQMAATLQQGGGQRYDVLALDVVWLAEFAQAGYLRELRARWIGADRFLDAPLASARFDGSLWAVPFTTDAGLLYFRTDLLSQVTQIPPATWSQVADQAARISATRPGLVGYVGQFRQYEGLTVNLLEQMWGAPSAPPAPSERDPGDGGLLALIDSPAAVEGLGFIAGGRCGAGSGWLDPQASNADEESSRLAFQRGKAVFMRNWPYAYRLLQAPDSSVRGRFAVVGLPGPTALGGYDLAIAAASPHQRTALDFIRFLTAEPSQRQLFAAGGFAPTLRSLYANPGLQHDFPYLRPLRDSVERARVRAVTPYYNEVSAQIQSAGAKVLACTLSPRQAAGQLRRVLPEALAGHSPR